MIGQILKGLTTNRAQTRPAHPDRRLRSRRYPIPFRTVWVAVTAVVDDRGAWTITRLDLSRGDVEAEAESRIIKRVDDIQISVRLDSLGLTSVDVTSAARSGMGDLGANARRIGRFLRDLDRELGIDPDIPPIAERISRRTPVPSISPVRAT